MSVRLIKALDSVKELPEISIGKIVAHIENEALLILCLVSILPFLQPIPLPGLSSILGAVALLQGLALIFIDRPLLTKKMKSLKISHEKFEVIYRAAVKFSRFTSKMSVMKHSIIVSKVSRMICGTAIVLSAAFLSLPLPIPFSNFIPALSIFFICIGLLEEDFILVLTGLGITFTVGWMAIFSFHLIRDQLGNFFL